MDAQMNLKAPPGAPEALVAAALVDVATELRLTDACALIRMIDADEAANIADLVNSSTELYFKSGALRYALAAQYRAAWNATPEVELALEFRHDRVCAFFNLRLGERRAGVELLDVLYDETGLDEEAKAAQLAAALDGARLPR